MCQKEIETMNKIKVSVIVPVYNVQLYLEQCIDSLINQTHVNLEIILVDDGSKDASGEICDGYKKKDSRVKVCHIKNSGAALAREIGLKKATGDYVSFVDADDYMEVDAYEKFANILSRYNPDVLCFSMKEEYETHILERYNKFDEGFYDKSRMYAEVYSRMLSDKCFFDFGILPNLCCKIIKRSLLENNSIRVNSCVKYGEDADMTFQLLASAQSIYVSKLSPYYYIKRKGTMTYTKVCEREITALEEDLRTGFIRENIYTLMHKQLQEYILFIRLLKKPSSVGWVNKSLKGKRVALYGAGLFGCAIYEEYREDIYIWVDANYNGLAEAIPSVQNPICLKSNTDKYDIIFVAVTNAEAVKQIESKLVKMDLKKIILHINPRDVLE